MVEVGEIEGLYATLLKKTKGRKPRKRGQVLGMNGTGGGKFGSPFVHPLPISHIV